MAKIDVTRTNSLMDLINSILAGLAEEDHIEEANDTRKRLSNIDGQKLFIYKWWALKSKEDFDRLNNESAYPREIGKGSRPEYGEPSTKEKDVMMNNAKPHGFVTGKSLGMGGLTPLDVVFEDEAPYSASEFPIIALGATRPRQEDFERIKNNKANIETLNLEELRWKWDMYSGNGEGPQSYIKGRVVDVEKVADLGIDISYDLDPGSLTPEQVEKIFASPDLGVNDAVVDAEIGSNHRTEIPTDRGYFSIKAVELDVPIICRAKAKDYAENKIGHINPGRPFKLTGNDYKNERVIIPLTPKEVNNKEPVILIYPFVNPKKHKIPLEPFWDSENVTRLGAGITQDTELGFHCRKKSSKPLEGKGYYYAFIAHRIGKFTWEKIELQKQQWDAKLFISKNQNKPYAAGDFEQFIKRLAYNHKHEWGFTAAETIQTTFNVPSSINGEFRIYMLVTKNITLQNDFFEKIFKYETNPDSKVKDQLFDFNYKTFIVGKQPDFDTKTPIRIKARLIDLHPEIPGFDSNSFSGATGRQIYEKYPDGKSITAHQVTAGIIFKKGNKIDFEEQKVDMDPEGKFVFESNPGKICVEDFDDKLIEPITSFDISRHKDIFKGFTAKNLMAGEKDYPAGVILYKWITAADSGNNLYKVYHIVEGAVSPLGRGGMQFYGVHGPNPFLSDNGSSIGVKLNEVIVSHSGIPIRFIKNQNAHTEETWVIIPWIDDLVNKAKENKATKGQGKKIKKDARGLAEDPELGDQGIEWKSKLQTEKYKKLDKDLKKLFLTDKGNLRDKFKSVTRTKETVNVTIKIIDLLIDYANGKTDPKRSVFDLIRDKLNANELKILGVAPEELTNKIISQLVDDCIKDVENETLKKR